MKTIVLAFLMVIGAVTQSHSGTTQQWTVSQGGNGHYYRLVVPVGGVTWEQARIAAANAGGYLATITSEEEKAFVLGMAAGFNSDNYSYTFLGGAQTTGSGSPASGWTWVTGEPFSYAPWASGEPNDAGGSEDRLMMWVNAWHAGRFNDCPNIVEARFPCSYLIESEVPTGQVPIPAQKIFLAFGQPSSFRLIIVPLAFGRSWPIVEPFSSMPAATVDATYRDSVTAQVKSIFSRSGVNNIDWVTTDSDDAVVVYFCPLINPDILGYSRGAPDRFNSKRRGEVIVFVNESSPLANLDAESAAHEVGHSLGLRHVDPSTADPLNNEVMDLDFSSDPQFTNTISDITDITSFATHNPRYHLLRYIDGWSPTQLQNEGIEPGTWDLGTSIFTKLSFQGANLRLHNITLYASGVDVESTFVLEQISSATLSELSQRSFTIPKGMKVTLLASSTEGGAPDVISATGDPFVGENQHVAVDAATTPFSLYRQDSPTVAVPIASATADSDLTTPYCNLSLTSPNILRLDFRGTLQQSPNLSDWSDLGLDTTSPHFVVIPPGQGTGFFRSKQPATP